MSNFSITSVARDAKEAAVQIASLTSEQKDNVLYGMASVLRKHTTQIIQENQKDLIAAKKNHLNEAMVDRLLLNESRIEEIAQAIEAIACQGDPVGKINHQYQLDNGLHVQKRSIPLGVIGMIYESRPNVTADAAALCFKAGNAVILRGGKEAINSNIIIGKLLQDALVQNGVSKGAVGIVSDPSREHMAELLKLDDYIDLIIPRGGESLIRYVSENSRIPVIQHYKGVCHLYIDKEADLKKATAILLNGKVQRPGVCNAIETLLVHQDFGNENIKAIISSLEKSKVQIHPCEKSILFCSNPQELSVATSNDYAAEYLKLEIAIKLVNNSDCAIAHILEYSSSHTEVIITENEATANKFVSSINSSVVMVNASSRFSDGGQLGLGAEIGISTSKLHAYGPMGAAALTTEKFVIVGDGQIRE
jgi:glutamate-5-semialdehyde dehydrogenase